MSSKIIVIVGPTASGKTKVSIEVAKKLNAQIINGDAVQVYQDVIIGSAKTTKEEMDGIKHHLIDFVPLSERYTLYNYQKDGRKILDELISQNKNIVIVGGTGLYVKALLYNYELDKEEKKNLEYIDLSNEELKAIIDDIHPENDVHVNNRKRMLRFLEHYSNTEDIIQNKQGKDEHLYNFQIIGLKPNREELYEYINKRVDVMFEKGLLEEAYELFKQNKNTNNIIGYKELNEYFRNEITLETAIEKIKQDTRKYAKRQFTFFMNQFKDIKWIDVNYKEFNKIIKEVIDIIE